MGNDPKPQNASRKTTLNDRNRVSSGVSTTANTVVNATATVNKT